MKLTKTCTPIFILLIVSLVIGLFTFRDYGLSWDEPLFYKYADALGYAYTPANWFSGHFDLNNSYGPSATDHADRGPAYLLIAREPVYLLQAIGLDNASAWHLINFITFLLGVYFLYKLSLRWLQPWSAFAATALFTTQPLFWEHAFINPKDMPFLVFFTGAIYLGFVMVDNFKDETHKLLWDVLLAGLFLGIATNVRVLGPLAGLVVLAYFFLTQKPTRQKLIWLFVWGILAIVIMIVAWPYLWQDSMARLIETFHSMSTNPITIPVLFAGETYHASELPRRFFPVMTLITLTEPVWPLFAIGLGLAIWRVFKKQIEWKSLALVFLWFAGMYISVIVTPPPIYDGGYRRMIFIFPPVFVFVGFVFDEIFKRLPQIWWRMILIAALLAPGIIGYIQLHPYEYTYYNSFVGGTQGAFRKYETDYWLTCYKEAVEQFDQASTSPVTLFVQREAYIAATYANQNVNIQDVRADFKGIQSGDYVLINTRANEDIRNFHGDPVVLTVGRAGATFCAIKRIP
jgi:4-amino-4-deoxy-L-arabinose transferase-like glycosyltransferase